MSVKSLSQNNNLVMVKTRDVQTHKKHKLYLPKETTIKKGDTIIYRK